MKSEHPYTHLNRKIAEVKQQQQEAYIDLKKELQLAFKEVTPENVLNHGISELLCTGPKKIFWSSVSAVIGNWIIRSIKPKKENSFLPILEHISQILLTGFSKYQSQKQ